MKFDVGFAYIFADSPSSNQNHGSTAAIRPDQGQLRRERVRSSAVQVTYTF